MTLRYVFSALVLSSTLSTPAQAHPPPSNRTKGFTLTTTVKDPVVECAPYYYSPVDSRLASFPPIWEPAFILPGDTNAESKWESIRHSVPNISTKGTPSGDISKVSYSSNDTDCWWTYSKCSKPKVQGLPKDVAEIPEPYTLAYGFDDGPNCSHNAFYDYLLTQKQRATMFYIGSNVMDWPLEAKRAVTDGHEICVHTWSHRYMTAFSSRDAFAELYYTMQAIKLVTHVTPTCWRPPFGDVDDRIRAIAHGLGLQTILWKYDTNDWRVDGAGSDSITKDQVDANYEALLREAEKGTFSKSGAILLAHELDNFTMSEAVKYYEKLKSAFHNIVPLGVALNKTQPYVEDDFSLPDFSTYVSGSVSPESGSIPSGENGGVVSNSIPLPGGENEGMLEDQDPGEEDVDTAVSSTSCRNSALRFGAFISLVTIIVCMSAVW